MIPPDQHFLIRPTPLAIAPAALEHSLTRPNLRLAASLIALSHLGIPAFARLARVT